MNTSPWASIRPLPICIQALAWPPVLESRSQPGGFFLMLTGLGSLPIPPAFSLQLRLALDPCETSPWNGKAELWPSAPGPILANGSLPRGNAQLPEVLCKNLGS